MNKETKIGIIVALALGMLYWGGSFLSGSNPFKNKKEYTAFYSDVNGLLVSNEVRFQGFKVGMVSGISYNNDLGKWKVNFSVDEQSLVLKDSAVARIGSADILGTMIIELNNINRGTKVLSPGDTLLSSVQKGITEEVDERIKPLVLKVEGLISSVDSVIDIVTVLLDEKTINNLKSSLEKFSFAIDNLNHSSESVDSIITDVKNKNVGQLVANVVSITENLKNNNEQLTAIFANLEGITDSIAKSNVKQTMEHLAGVMQKVDSIASDVQKGKGSLGLLLKDDKLYNGLALSAADLDLLLLDLRENPKRYFHFSMFGKKNKKKEGLERDTSEYIEMFGPMFQKMIEMELKKTDQTKKPKG